MNWKKIFTILKVILILTLLILMFTIQNYRSSDCAYCKFELEGKEVRVNKFMEAYSEMCFPKYEEELNFTLKNNS